MKIRVRYGNVEESVVGLVSIRPGLVYETEASPLQRIP